MQASVHRFDETSGEGSVLLDDGRERSFGAAAFGASGLRHLRVGQRLSVETGTGVDPTGDATVEAGGDTEVVTRLWIVGIGEGQRIG